MSEAKAGLLLQPPQQNVTQRRKMGRCLPLHTAQQGMFPPEHGDKHQNGFLGFNGEFHQGLHNEKSLLTGKEMTSVRPVCLCFKRENKISLV